MEINAVQKAEASPVVIDYTPPPIITFLDIVNTLDVIRSQEDVDRTMLNTLIVVDEVDLRNRLVLWGTAGFPTAHVLYTLQFNHLEKCSDGIVRNDIINYIHYLYPSMTIVNLLTMIEPRLPGMALSYSYTNDFILRIHVSRKD